MKPSEDNPTSAPDSPAAPRRVVRCPRASFSSSRTAPVTIAAMLSTRENRAGAGVSGAGHAGFGTAEHVRLVYPVRVAVAGRHERQPPAVDRGRALGVAGSNGSIAVATESGSIVYFDASTLTQEGEIAYPASEVLLSSDGSVLAALGAQQSGTGVTNIYSLPGGGLTYTWSGMSYITLAASGTVIGQVTPSGCMANPTTGAQRSSPVAAAPSFSGRPTVPCSRLPRAWTPHWRIRILEPILCRMGLRLLQSRVCPSDGSMMDIWWSTRSPSKSTQPVLRRSMPVATCIPRPDRVPATVPCRRSRRSRR